MIDGYFTRRTLPQAPDYEAAYWGVVVDPDGRVRDRLLEREQHLADVAQELSFIASLPPGRLLDVGCGLGYLLSGVAPAWERHGVEISQFAGKHARQWGQIFIGDLSAARYPAEHFDAIVLHHVIEHVSDPITLLQEIKRVLRPDGWLVLGTPDFDSGAARRFGPKYRLLHDPTHISLFTNDSMHCCLRDLGFVIARVEYPFFETRHFTLENLQRLFDTSQISPPFYGNFMTFYARKPGQGQAPAALALAGQALLRAATAVAAPAVQAAARITARLARGGQVYLAGGAAAEAQNAPVGAEWVAPGKTPAKPLDANAVILAETQPEAWVTSAHSNGALTVYLGPDAPHLSDAFDVMVSWPAIASVWQPGVRAAVWAGLSQEIAKQRAMAARIGPTQR